MPATLAMVAMAKSMFGAGSDFPLTSARTASATASCADFGAARRTRSSSKMARGSPARYTKWPNPGTFSPAVGIPVETHCHNDLGMAVANSVSGALGDLDAGQDAWVNTCVNGIGERSGNADLLSCILAFRYGFGVSESVSVGDPLDLSWARRFGLWAAYAFGQPLPPAWPGVGRNAFAHESGIHADGALKDRGNYELYDDSVLGPFPSDWFTREGRVVLTGEYGGKAGFRHVLDGLGIAVADGQEDLVFSLVQLCASATGKPLTDDELRLIAGYPRQLALLFPGQL